MNSSLVLAYIGDAVYEIHVRKFLITKNLAKVNLLQKEAVKYVSAKGQKHYLEKMINASFLSAEEEDIVRKARNQKTNSHPKNTDIITYKKATGLEALIGHLYLEKNEERIEEIMNFILGEEC